MIHQNSRETLQYLKSLTDTVNIHCMPLENVSIKFFTYTRLYKDGTAIFLCNSDKWYDTKFEHDIFEQDGFVTVQNLYRNEYTKCIFTGEPNKNIKVLGHMYNLDFWNSIDLYRYTTEYREVFNFSGSCKNGQIINFYINNFAFLTKFACSFRNKFSSLLTHPPKEAFINVYNTRENTLIDDHDNVENDITVPQVMHILHDNKDITLSKRQKECLLLILKGKTAKEIAKDLNLSYRTVEQYTNFLKVKLECQNRRELIERMIKNESVKEYF